MVKTTYAVLEGPANALAINKDATFAAVAGRNVFKIFNVEDNGLSEKVNLRVGKNINLNYSCADVVWNPIEDNILATAATNGAVVTWNLNKVSRSKQDMVFQQHKRTVNKVSFHPLDPNALISGSQDGTMKYFDLRKKDVTYTFYSNSESVRDIQFSQHQPNMFAAVQENGQIQLWDLRRTDKYEKQFTGHNGPVFACDWHPDERRWLATAGRDKTIKVWDLSGKAVAECAIHTIAPVSRIKWRPQRKYHIASSSLVVDFSVNIWDTRRPFIPFAAFTEHKDVTTGLVWRNSPQVFLSTGKDSTLYQHAFSDADRPADHANPMGLDVNLRGDVLFASSDRILNDSGVGKYNTYSGGTVTKLPAFFRRGSSLGDQFPVATSTCMNHFNRGEKYLSMHWLTESAKKYQLTGRTFTDMCDHNAAVALDLGRALVANTWHELKILYGNCISVAQTDQPRSGQSVDVDKGTLETISMPQEAPSSDQKSVRHHSGSAAVVHIDRTGDTSTGFSEEDTETDETDHDRTLTNIASGMVNTHIDFFFGDGEYAQPTIYEYYDDPGMPMDETDDWILPNEAFNTRHEIYSHSPPPEHICNPTFSPGAFSHHRAVTANSTSPSGNLQVTEQNDLLVVKQEFLELPEFDYTNIIVDMLQFFAAHGDVQMSVSILLMLGDRFRGVIDDLIQEQWYMSYIELLTRFQLWSISNEIINLCPVPAVNSLNQQSTVIHTNCNNCLKQLVRCGWFCDKCKMFTNRCSVCHKVVRGLYVWCQGCSHGGHLLHFKEWFARNSFCPTGCGHRCTFT